jgi:hypothetical protein
MPDTRKASQIDVVAHFVSVTNAFLPPPEMVPIPAVIYDRRLPKMGAEDFHYLSKGFVYETNSPEVSALLSPVGRR